MNPDPGNIPLYNFIIFLLILCNALLILMTGAFDSVSRTNVRHIIETEKDRRAIRLANLLKKPLEYRYTNRLISVLIMCAGSAIIFIQWNQGGGWLRLAIYLILLVSMGEIFPLKLSIMHREKMALAFAGIQRGLCVFFFPATKMAVIIANTFLRIFRQRVEDVDREFSEEEVMSMLEVGQEKGELKEEGKKMIDSIFRFDDELAYEIMTPRTDVFMIDLNDPTNEYMDKLMELRYSRIPVYQDDPDNIKGIILIKDYLIKARKAGFDKVDIKSILRKPYFVPETKNIDALFVELQQDKQHMAVLIDEYGGFSGIVTMEDIIEEIVGDIDDEYDEDDEIIEKTGENTYLIDGNVDIDDLNEELNSDFESENSETVGGLILDTIGRIPEDGYVNKTVIIGKYIFTILSVNGRRIKKVKLEIEKREADGDEEGKVDIRKADAETSEESGSVG